jgi:AraC-like DNA-binding protein
VEARAGVLRIQQHLRISGREVGTDVSGPACVVAEVRVKRGTVAYLRGQTRIQAPVAFAIVLPPYTIVQAVLEHADVTTSAVACRPPDGCRLPREPLLLPPGRDVPLRGVEAICDRLRWAEGEIEVGRTADPRSLAGRGKRIIDAEYGAPLLIGSIAARLLAAPPVLSRAFLAAYGVPPVRYRHQTRIVDALLRFAEGAVPMDVFQDVGFDDLSRFYKVFRKVACAAPGAYRAAVSRNAKT